MERNLKRREFLEADKPLATNLVLAASNDPDMRHLLPKYQDWLADINAQLDGGK